MNGSPVTEDRVQAGTIYEVRPDGRWNIYLDATMCGSFGVCPQMFKYSFVDNLAPKGDRPFARDLGSWWSSVMENIYTLIADAQKKNYFGLRPEPMSIVQMAIAKWHELDMNKLEEFHPRQFKEFGGMAGAIQMISEYAERQLPIDLSTWKIIAAEASFGRDREVIIGENNEVVLHWLGQPDLYVIFDGRVMPVDHKSLAKLDPYTAKRYKPHIQLPGYIIAGQILTRSLGINLPIDRCIINAVARSDSSYKTSGEKRPRFKRFFISYTPAELEEWKARRLEQATRLRQYFESGAWPWNEYACSNQWNRPCAFQNIDEKPPETRQIVINADYIKREPWIPGRLEKEKENTSES